MQNAQGLRRGSPRGAPHLRRPAAHGGSRTGGTTPGFVVGAAGCGTPPPGAVVCRCLVACAPRLQATGPVPAASYMALGCRDVGARPTHRARDRRLGDSLAARLRCRPKRRGAIVAPCRSPVASGTCSIRSSATRSRPTRGAGPRSSRADRVREPGRLRGLSRADRRRSGRRGQLPVRARPAVHPVRGADIPAAGPAVTDGRRRGDHSAPGVDSRAAGPHTRVAQLRRGAS